MHDKKSKFCSVLPSGDIFWPMQEITRQIGGKTSYIMFSVISSAIYRKIHNLKFNKSYGTQAVLLQVIFWWFYICSFAYIFIVVVWVLFHCSDFWMSRKEFACIITVHSCCRMMFQGRELRSRRCEMSCLTSLEIQAVSW